MQIVLLKPRFPRVGRLDHILNHGLVVGVNFSQTEQLLELVHFYKVWLFSFLFLKYEDAFNQGVPFSLRYVLFLVHQDFDANQETQNPFVTVEKSPANIVKNGQRDIVNQMRNTILGGLAIVNNSRVEVSKVIERELVHGVDQGQIGNHEI